ncbi:hypothetical protein LLEC1_02605 [Akanthomyces lecanii]|uniref:Uncharacterized protein n=1 Tax=Cordyceps confragosa TaxID=2714763 RepID=A0A179IFU0_CORDF|nr:hypothetical protein LLEC1_02605 [Akanthomyces lecanii]
MVVFKATDQSHRADQQASSSRTSDSELDLSKEQPITVAEIYQGAFSESCHVPQPEQSEKPLSQPPLLCLGMARTGTASLCAALNILGVNRVHHGLQVPFTRADWDELFREYDVGTDLTSFFAMSLIEAYPDAQVILVERDIERWHKSIGLLFEPWTRWSNRMLMRILGRLAGTKSGIAAYKFTMGWTESAKPSDIMKNARAAYVKHYEDIRAVVPAEQLLEYKLTDGWEPLAAFLGKPAPAPDVRLPHINDAADFIEHRRSYEKYFLKRALKKICRARF